MVIAPWTEYGNRRAKTLKIFLFLGGFLNLCGVCPLFLGTYSIYPLWIGWSSNMLAWTMTYTILTAFVPMLIKKHPE